MSASEAIIIYGGSFDPPHLGHLNTASTVHKFFNPKQFKFIPCKAPVLKPANLATTIERIDMLTLALQDYPEFEMDLREINRNTPSFMVDTLQSLREEYTTNTPLCLLIGIDAFHQLMQWHQWWRILTLSHIIVMNRTMSTTTLLPTELELLRTKHEVLDKQALFKKSFGNIYFINAGLYDISSSWLRSQVHAQKDISLYVPDRVNKYIKMHNLYL